MAVMDKMFKDERLPILFIVDDPDLLADVKKHVAKKYADFKTVSNVDDASKVCDAEKPHIIFIGTKKLLDSEHIYLNLLRRVKDFEFHRAVIMVQAAESKKAFQLCQDKVFSDYIITNPLYDTEIFNTAIMRSIEILEDNDALEHLHDIEKTLRKMQFANDRNQQVERSLQKKARSIQKQLTQTINENVKGLNGQISEDIKAGNFSGIQSKISGFNSSVNNTLSASNIGMEQMISEWETELSVIHNDLNEGLLGSIKTIGIQRKILVVEDDSFYYGVLENILSSVGYKVKVAPSGKLALELVKTYEPDLILLDWNLPDLKGSHVLKTIKNEIKTCHIPVIILTGHSHPEIVKDSMSNGASSFIVKPSEKQYILSKVEEALFGLTPSGH